METVMRRSEAINQAQIRRLPGAAEAVILGGAARVVEGDGLQADGAAAGDRRAGAGACVRHDGERAVRAGAH